MTHKCNDNDTVINFNIVEGELKELLVKSIGDNSVIVIKNEKEITLKKYEPKKWFNYNVDCQEQYISIYNIKKNER